MRKFRALAKKYRQSDQRRALRNATRTSAARLTRQGALQLELLESRCMLAAGNFLRLDGIPPGSVPTSDDLSAAQATEAHAHSFDRPNNVLIVDDDPAPFGGPHWTVERDEILAWSGGISNASVPNADANATAQALSQVVTDIGNTVAAPTVSLVAAQLGLATGSDDLVDDVNVGARGDARSESILYTRFQYQAPPGEESLPFLFNGFIHAAAGGVVSSEGNGSAGMGTLITPPLLIDPPPGPPLDINGIRIWLEGAPPILLAEVYFQGVGQSHEGSPPATTGEWTIWGSVRNLEGQYQSFFQTGSGAQALIPFYAEIGDGSVIVFDADPNRNPAGFSDVGGVGGYASVGEGEEAYENDRAQANVFQVINAWGFADNNLDPPPDDEPIFDDGEGGPGDLNGDGVNDGQDAGLWAQILADYAARGLTPLIVTTEDDIANGDYSFGDLSLREAITRAASANYSGPDTIVFAPWVQEIDLNGTQLPVGNGNNVSIIGPGADKLTIDGQNSSRVFLIATGGSATLRGLHITRGLINAGGGGGITSTGALTVDQCLIDFCSAPTGGAIFRQSGALVITNSTIANNVATQVGGGIHLLSTASATIANSTFSTNTAAFGGGGIYNNGLAAALLLNSTVTNNNSGSGASGIFSAGMILHNSIVAGNTANRDVSGSFSTSSSYNLIGYDSNLSNGINNDATNQVGGQSGAPAINALLGPLQDNGGAILTHALLAGSPAIDKGDPNFDPNAFSPPRLYDERAGGFPRIIDGDAIFGARVDVGSYEYQPPQSVVSAAAIDAGFADYELTQRDRMTLAALGIEEELPQKRRSLRPRVRGLLI